MPSEMWRLFIAIELPDSALALLGQLQANLKERTPAQSVRWVAPGSIHLTLKFLGDVPTPDVDAIRFALGETVKGHAPFELSTGSLGCFPNATRPRVIWIGIECF